MGWVLSARLAAGLSNWTDRAWQTAENAWDAAARGLACALQVQGEQVPQDRLLARGHRQPVRFEHRAIKLIVQLAQPRRRGVIQRRERPLFERPSTLACTQDLCQSEQFSNGQRRILRAPDVKASERKDPCPRSAGSF